VVLTYKSLWSLVSQTTYQSCWVTTHQLRSPPAVPASTQHSVHQPCFQLLVSACLNSAICQHRQTTPPDLSILLHHCHSLTNHTISTYDLIQMLHTNLLLVFHNNFNHTSNLLVPCAPQEKCHSKSYDKLRCHIGSNLQPDTDSKSQFFYIQAFFTKAVEISLNICYEQARITMLYQWHSSMLTSEMYLMTSEMYTVFYLQGQKQPHHNASCHQHKTIYAHRITVIFFIHAHFFLIKTDKSNDTSVILCESS